MERLIRDLFGKQVSNVKAVELDLSAKNPRLLEVDLDNQFEFESFIHSELSINNAGIGYGGYLENRIIYRRSVHFDVGEQARSIHLGIDIWLPANTYVQAPRSGHVHSFKNNDAYGDYGATIILKHPHPKGEFYSLYGHLDAASLLQIHVGQYIEKGQAFAKVGSWNENGNWPPHLHFQCIKSMSEYVGDFPGVCQLDEVQSFVENCPNPLEWLYSTGNDNGGTTESE
jgi:murein DD-endopeptidase MepM/ murein hydrolase activator NlpD